MKNEEKLKMNKLDDMELEGVVGGTYDQSMAVAGFLQKAGYKDMFKKDGISVNFDAMRSAIDGLGFESKDHGGIKLFGGKDNTYVERSTGKVFSQDEFMGLLQQKFPGVK